MGRDSFLAYFEQVVVDSSGAKTTQKTTTVITMIDRVSKALDLENSTAKLQMGLAQVKKRASYEKNFWKKDADGNWIQSKKTIDAADIPFTFDSKARKNKITLFVRGKAGNVKSKRTLTVTASATLTVNQIGDALGSLIPTSKRGSSATDIEPFFSVNGGRRYPLPTKAAADATTEVKVPESQAEITATLAAAEPQKPAK